MTVVGTLPVVITVPAHRARQPFQKTATFVWYVFMKKKICNKENVTAKRLCGRKVKYMNIYGNKAAKKTM